MGLLRRRSPVENLTLPVDRAFFHVPRFNVIAYSRTTDRAGMLEQFDLEIGECLGTLVLSFHPLVDEGCGCASAVAAGRLEKSMDKPVEDCNADMGMLLMLWFDANILPHLAVWSVPFFIPPPPPAIVTKSVFGTTICHEIVDFGREAPQRKLC